MGHDPPFALPPAPVAIDSTRVRLGDKAYVYFGGCDYYRLSWHPKVRAAFQAAVKRFGLNVAASRLTTGNHVLYEELERALEDFFGADCAVTAPTAYTANLMIGQTFQGKFTHALIDADAHPSLQDGARFLQCPVIIFRHCDPDSLAQAVRQAGRRARLVIITDGLFARDGAMAPLPAYAERLPANTFWWIDEAHAAGVMGERGRGTFEFHRFSPARSVRTVTFSKAFGVYGGAILLSREWRARVQQTPLFGGSTPVLLPCAAAARTALKIVQRDSALRRRLQNNSRYVRSNTPIPTACGEYAGPIFSWVPRKTSSLQAFADEAARLDILPPIIRYFGRDRVRIAVSSEHTPEQLRALVLSCRALFPEKIAGRG